MTSPVNLGRYGQYHSRPDNGYALDETRMLLTSPPSPSPFPFSFPLPLTKMAPHKRDG